MPPLPASTVVGDQFEVSWMIESGTPFEGERLVRRSDTVFDTRLLPPRLFRLETGVNKANGSRLLAAGQELIGLVSRTMIACTIAPPSTRGLGAALWAGTDRHICLVDANRDGKFEAYFHHTVDDDYAIMGWGKVPEKPRAIQPVAYREDAPHTVGATPRLRVVFNGFGHNALSLCVSGGGDRENCLEKRWRVDASTVPVEVTVLGATFEISTGDAEGKVAKIAMKSPFEAQPFAPYAPRRLF